MSFYAQKLREPRLSRESRGGLSRESTRGNKINGIECGLFYDLIGGRLSPVVPVVHRRDLPPSVATYVACEGRGRGVPVDPQGLPIRRRKRRAKIIGLAPSPSLPAGEGVRLRRYDRTRVHRALARARVLEARNSAFAPYTARHSSPHSKARKPAFPTASIVRRTRKRFSRLRERLARNQHCRSLQDSLDGFRRAQPYTP